MYENTDLTLQELADKFTVSLKRIRNFVNSNYTIDFRRERKRRCYRKSKLGDKNPMKGLCGEKHYTYKGIISDNKTYYIILKPDWYTGRKILNISFIITKLYAKI